MYQARFFAWAISSTRTLMLSPTRFFVGSINPINVHGLEWFVERVFLQIKKGRPDVELAVAGAVGGERTWPIGTLALGPHKRSPLYTQMLLWSSILSSSTGLPITITEALSCGKPVIATPANLEADIRGALSLAGTPDAFVEQIHELLETEPSRRSMPQ
jgi:hypothetical protein